MRIALVQLEPVAGDINRNLTRHLGLIEKAIAADSDLVMFPELSLTGYEPTLAKNLAIDVNDSRFDTVQRISDDSNVAVGFGVPTKYGDDVRISVLLFRPEHSRQVFSKAYLHPDEEPYFVCGPRPADLLIADDERVALAICFELSVEEHVEYAAEHGATVYLASVAKTSEGVVDARKRLSAIAHRYSMTTLMVNAVGMADGVMCAGTSSVWNRSGVPLGNLDSTEEGLVVVDTKTAEVNLLKDV